MNITGFDKIAPYLTQPLVLVGFVLLLAYGIHWQLMRSGLLSQVSKKDSGLIIRLFLRYGFWLALVLLLVGFGLQFSGIGLSAWNKWMEKEKAVAEKETVLAVNAGKVAERLYAQLDTKDQQLSAKDEQIKSLTEAITALSKADAPAKDINAALRALEQGDTKEAEAIFAEVLRTKEAEGQKATKEAAAAARHLGALAFWNNPKEALIAYQKAVQLDPDNADGWNELGKLLQRTGKFVQAEEAFHKVLALAEAHQDKEEKAMALGNLGNVYDTQGKLDKAEEMYRKVLEIHQALGSKEGLAKDYNNQGIVYYSRGELDKAEEMYRKALELNETLGSKQGMAANYINLGIVYYTRGDLDKAEEMHWKAVEIHQALGSREDLARDHANLGIVYYTLGKLDKAEEMYRKGLELDKALGSKQGMTQNLGNLGFVYSDQGELENTKLMYLESSEDMYRIMLRKHNYIIAANHVYLGSLYKQKGNLDQAEEFWRKGLSRYQEMGHPNAEMVQQWLDKLAEARTSSTQ